MPLSIINRKTVSMKKWLIGSMICALSGVVFLAACKKKNSDDDNTPSNNFDRKAMLTNYADNYIVPAYTVMESSLQELKGRTEVFTSIPNDQNYANVLNAWLEAYNVWQRVDMLEFGPAEDVSLRMYINTYPVTTSKVEANITVGSYDLESFNNKDAQGFPAINYLLSNGDKATIKALYTTDSKAAARKKYLNDVVDKMLQKVKGVKEAWGTYRTTFVNATGTDAGSSTSKMVNAFVLYYERYFRSGKIGLPVGAMTGVAKPELVEAYYTPDFSNQLAIISLSAVMAFYEGRSFDGNAVGSSMKSYLKAIGTKDDNGALMADVITTELTDVDTKLKALQVSLKDAVQNNRPQVLAIYDEAQQVVPLIKVDMVSAFGISITYVDNDGD